MEEQKIVSTDGKIRLHVKTNCLNCNKEIWKIKTEFTLGQNYYCNRICFNEYKSKINTIQLKCSYCGKEFTRKKSAIKTNVSGLFFCCKEHKNLSQQIETGILVAKNYGSGYRGYRAIAFRNLPNICNKCGNNDIEVLEVHHIDGNRKNRDLSNLEILCANCHTKIEFANKRNILSVKK